MWNKVARKLKMPSIFPYLTEQIDIDEMSS